MLSKLIEESFKSKVVKTIGDAAAGAALGSVVGPATGAFGGADIGIVASPFETVYDAATGNIPDNTTFGQQFMNNWDDYIDAGWDLGLPVGAGLGTLMGTSAGAFGFNNQNNQSQNAHSEKFNNFKRKSEQDFNRFRKNSPFINENTKYKINILNEYIEEFFFNKNDKKMNLSDFESISSSSVNAVMLQKIFKKCIKNYNKDYSKDDYKFNIDYIKDIIKKNFGVQETTILAYANEGSKALVKINQKIYLLDTSMDKSSKKYTISDIKNTINKLQKFKNCDEKQFISFYNNF